MDGEPLTHLHVQSLTHACADTHTHYVARARAHTDTHPHTHRYTRTDTPAHNLHTCSKHRIAALVRAGRNSEQYAGL